MGDDWGTKGRVLFADYVVVVVAAFVVVALAGGALVYTTHLDPETESTQEVTGVWETTGSFTHGATVVEENRVFPVGQTLEDRSLYYTQLSPELTGTFTYQFDAPGGHVDVDAQTMLVIRSSSDGEEFWRVEEPLDEESATLEPGETVTTSFAVNVTDVMDEIDAVEDDLGASPGSTDVRIVARVSGDGSALGEPVTVGDTFELELSPGASTYGVESPGTVSESHEQFETRTEPVSYGLLRQLAGPLLLLVGFLGIAAVGAALGRGDLEVPETERRALELEQEREEFDDWISTGQLPEQARRRPTVEMASLEDLVDTAIDSNRRVLHDREDACYHVVDDVLHFVYRPAGVSKKTLRPDEDTVGDEPEPGVPGHEDTEARDETTDGADEMTTEVRSSGDNRATVDLGPGPADERSGDGEGEPQDLERSQSESESSPGSTGW